MEYAGRGVPWTVRAQRTATATARAGSAPTAYARAASADRLGRLRVREIGVPQVDRLDVLQ